MRVGEKLPSIRELAQQFNVHRNTVYLALNDLVAEGLLCSLPKKGFYVDPSIVEYYQLKQKKIVSHKRGTAKSRLFYDLRSGTADLRNFDLNAFKHNFNHAITKMTHRDFEYGFTAGHPKLIAVLNSYLWQMRDIQQPDLLITNGSQEALYLLCQLLIRPSDTIALPALTYPAMKMLALQHNANIISIKLDAQGLEIDDLEKKLQQYRIRFLYITPHNQYPTTVTLPLSRRLKLLSLAKKYDFFIIEDDYAHEFSFAATPPTLASMDRQQRVCYVSSFSKILLPSMRVGFVSLPKNLYKPCLHLKNLISRQNEVLTQLTLAEMIHSGYFEQYLRRLRKIIKYRRTFLVSKLQSLAEIEFKVPQVGLVFWLQTGRLTKFIINNAERHGILIETEHSYSVKKINKAARFIRLGFAKYDEHELSYLFDKLFTILN